jgi:hypothetical protein
METQRCEDKASSAHQISPFLIGKPWENHGKTMEKPWENGDLHGKIHHFIAR